MREARLGAALSHPHLVAIHDLFEHGGEWLVVMERVRGPSAAELLGAGPLPARAVLELGLQVGAALQEIHAAGLVHRDVTPGNVLIDRTGVAKLADLGLLLLAGSADRPAGTPGYAAPEPIAGRPVPASDVFSLGAPCWCC